MFNNLIKDDDKKMVEPFNLVGRRSQIFSKKEAAKILKNNSYYFFVAAIFNFGLFTLLTINPIDVGISNKVILLFGFIYLVLGFSIRKLYSRLASIMGFMIFGWIILSRIIENDIGGFFFFSLIFFAASYRSIKASFYFHKN